MAILQWQAVKKCFGPHAAVAGVSLEVEPGERVALVGENGSGKTTLLRLAAGLCRPDAGRVIVAGHDVARHPLAVRRRLGYLPQRVELPANLTVGELLEFIARLRGTRRQEAARVAAGLGVTDFLARRAGTLSGGMAQRVALALALLGDPAVLLLDEPTAGVDLRRAGDLRGILDGATRAGSAVVMATHQLDDIEGWADRVVLLNGGRVALDAPAGEAGRPAAEGRIPAGVPAAGLRSTGSAYPTLVAAVPGAASEGRGTG